MKKLIIILVCGLCLKMNLNAQQVSLAQARQVAENFLNRGHKTALDLAKTFVVDQDTFMYVFNSQDAFVIIAADKSSVPVLAYSFQADFAQDNVPPAVGMWLQHYQNQINQLRKNQIIASPQTLKAWQSILSPRKDNNAVLAEIKPFLSSHWGQGKEYNYYCPLDASGAENKRAVTGCVATAMAQLMYYFQFPQTGTGSYSYQHDKYGTISADFSQAVYDYSTMSDKPLNINAAASLLTHHCGVAVDMVYGATASGMYNHKAAYALRNYFKFSPQTEYVFRDSVSLNWDSLIVYFLEQKIPLYYAGWRVPHTDGHAFICDGYQKFDDSTFYYHFNFGWNGAADGYFYTNALSPSGANFNLAQELIINAYPDTNLCTYPLPHPQTGEETLVTLDGSFDDGSGYFSDCQRNMDYTWHIAPDADNLSFISLRVEYDLTIGDTIFITSPNNAINVVLTNQDSIVSYTISTERITVRLKTASTGSSINGFRADYTCKVPTYCNRVVYNLPTRTFGDGSEDYNYNHFANCEFIISTASYDCLTLYFNKFETETEKDFLYIYQRNDGVDSLVLSLSGDKTDSTYFFNSNYLRLIFQTDHQTAYDGWKLTYTASKLGLKESYSTDKKWQLYPNPIRNEVNINYIGDEFVEAKAELRDVYGRVLATQKLSEYPAEIIVNDLSSGIYMLKIIAKNGDCNVIKFVKQ